MAHRDLDGLIRDARSVEAPSAAQREQVREALARRIASGGALPGLGGRSLATLRARWGWSGARAASLGLAAVAAGAIAVAALTVYDFGRDVPRQAPEAVSAPAPARPELGLEPAATARAPRDSAPANPPGAARAMSTPETSSGSNVRDATANTSATSGASNMGTPVGTSARARAGGRAPTPRDGRRSHADQEAERRALARVQHALRDGRFVEAIAGLDRDDQAFAGGALLEERAAARVLARCGSGDTAEAQRLAAAFVARHPRSPLRARVLASCPRSARGREP